jgi:hypothetical protein
MKKYSIAVIYALLWGLELKARNSRLGGSLLQTRREYYSIYEAFCEAMEFLDGKL